MNAPTGFTDDGRSGSRSSADPSSQRMLNPASVQQVIHMILAAYVAHGLRPSPAVQPFLLLRVAPVKFHRRAFGIALTVACAASRCRIVSGEPHRSRGRGDGEAREVRGDRIMWMTCCTLAGFSIAASGSMLVTRPSVIGSRWGVHPGVDGDDEDAGQQAAQLDDDPGDPVHDG